MLDLDNFKNINDTYGHQEGDKVIQKAADCIKAVIRRDDVAGRLGGDEFCIYFHGEITAKIVAERACRLCQEIRSIIPAEGAGISCSIGIVYCNSPKLTFQEIYKWADEALYQQKNNGRDGYTIYKDEGIK